MKTFRFIIISALIALNSSFAANDGGTESPFSFGAGARELSMGRADEATSSFETAPFWSPSRLASAQQFAVTGFHSQLFESGVAYQYLGFVAPTLDFGTFGIGIFRLGVNGIEVRDINNLLLGETDDNRLAIYLAYGRKLSSFDIGASVTMEHHSLHDYSATSSPGFNLSASKSMALKSSKFRSLDISLNIRNLIQPTIELDNDNVSYPGYGSISAVLGIVPFKDDNHQLSLAAKLGKAESINPDFSIGMEYAYNDLIFVRTGMNDSKFAAGLGIKYSLFSFDYAVIDRDLDLLHSFTLTTAFGKPVNERLAERLAKREAEFTNLMNRRLVEKNEALVKSLVKEGRDLFESGQLVDAQSVLQRAMFTAKANSLDTSSIAVVLKEATDRLDEVTRLKQFRENLDSAKTAFSRQDYVASKYFGSLALEQQPNSADAKQIIDKSTQALNNITERENLINQRLVRADSLLNYGKIGEAITLLSGLKQLYGDEPRVKNAWNKAEFERLKESANSLFTQNKIEEALNALDSALVIYPNHQWCLSLKSTIYAEQKKQSALLTSQAKAAPVQLSESMRKEAEQEYALAQEMFTRGDLAGAISHWERVENIAPGFQSVREYLVKAYKFLGVEYYSQGQLRQAISIWKKAAQLMPNNEEIASYIKRTETEIRKLEQLSYEPE